MVHYCVISREIQSLNIVRINDRLLDMCRTPTHSNQNIIMRPPGRGAESILMMECARSPADHLPSVTLSSTAKAVALSHIRIPCLVSERSPDPDVYDHDGTDGPCFHLPLD